MSAREMDLLTVAKFVARHAYHAPRCRHGDEDSMCTCGMTALREMVLRPIVPQPRSCTCAYPCNDCA